MDPSAGIGPFERFLSTLKEIPLWLLSGVTVALCVILYVPELRGAAPADALPWLTVAAIVFAVLTMFRLSSAFFTAWRTRRRATRRRERRRLNRIYQTLYNLFLTRHVTISSGVGAPYLRNRTARAYQILFSTRHRLAGIKRAFRALFDKRISTSAEVEFGGDFPLARILEIVRANANYADTELLTLVARADRARYEEAGSALLTDAELRLYFHIEDEYERLKRK